jgi:cell pole-organizing protein PopZ
MSEQTSQEPTMEEILASIRRIISEDDAPAEEAAVATAPAEVETAPVAEEPEPLEAAAPEPAPAEPEPGPVAAVAPEPEAAPEEEELELTEKVETHGDLDIYSAPADAPEPVAAQPAPPVAGLVSDRAASAAASSFGALSAAILMPKGDRTLEDVVRELLRPMLQQWLDDNLPTIVQTAVEAEVERIARSRVR